MAIQTPVPTHIDLSTYPRAKHFHYFLTMGYPYVGMTVQVDITDFYHWQKESGVPFFLAFLWCAARAANRVPALRQRIKDGEILEYPWCPTSHTVAREDGTYAYCQLDCRDDFVPFLQAARPVQEEAARHGTIEEDTSDLLPYFYVSTVPWVHYTSVIQPTPIPADSNPRFVWGKYQAEGGRVTMPVTVLCHHGLVDGRQIGDFYRELDVTMKEIQQKHENGVNA